MFYTSVGTDVPARARRKLDEDDDDDADVASLRERLHRSWPTDVCGSSVERVPLHALRSMAAEHNKPHTQCGYELWQVAGYFGKRRRYGICVTFSFRSVVDEAALPDVDASLPLLAAVQWTITDHAYAEQYCFSYVDARFAVLFSAQMAQGVVVAEPHVLQAMAEHMRASGGAAPLQADQLLPVASTSLRLATLDVSCGPCTLRFDSPTGSTPGRGQDGVYVLHLEGLTRHTSRRAGDKDGGGSSSGNKHTSSDRAASDDGDTIVCVKSVVDLVLHAGVGPFLDGLRGVVSPHRCGEHAHSAADTPHAASAFDADAVFAYTYPFARLRRGSLCLTRADDGYDLAREQDMHEGTAWVQHRFGAAVARTRDEVRALRAWRRRHQHACGGARDADVVTRPLPCARDDASCMSHAAVATSARATAPVGMPSYDVFWLRLYDTSQHTLTVVCQYRDDDDDDDDTSAAAHEGSDKRSDGEGDATSSSHARAHDTTRPAVCHVYAIVHSGAHRRARYYDGDDDGGGVVVVEARQSKLYRSLTTGLCYATEWQLRVPLYSGDGSANEDDGDYHVEGGQHDRPRDSSNNNNTAGSSSSIISSNADTDRRGATAALTVRVRFPQQEQVSTLAQPAVWQGTVTIDGSLVLPPHKHKHNNSNNNNSGVAADELDSELVTTVTGEGFVRSYRGGRRHARDVASLLSVLHRVTTAAVERDDALATLPSAAAAAEAASVLSCLGTVSALASLQDAALPDAYKLVLAALIGTYGYLHHCHDKQQQQQQQQQEQHGHTAVVDDADGTTRRHAMVCAALQWCQGKWLEYFGSSSGSGSGSYHACGGVVALDYRALVLRAFMLCELHRVLCTRHADLVALVMPCVAALTSSPHTALDVVTQCTAHAATAANTKRAVHRHTTTVTVDDDNDVEDAEEAAVCNAKMSDGSVRATFARPPSSLAAAAAAADMRAATVTWSPPRGVDVAQLKALLDGTWRVCARDAHRHADAYDRLALAAGACWTWRNYQRHALPSLECRVHDCRHGDDDEHSNGGDDDVYVDVVAVSALGRATRRLHVCGQTWQWPCHAWYGDVAEAGGSGSNGNNKSSSSPLVATSRACVLAGGHQLYVETALPRGGVARSWYAFAHDGTTMLWHVRLYKDGDDDSDNAAAAVPCVTCTLRYTMDAAAAPVRDAPVTQRTA